jgi:hypothetical protein
VRAAAYFQVVGRLGQAEVAEERVRHVRVVVLPGVHDARGAPALTRQLVVQRRDLHEIRTRGGDQVDDFRAHALRISMPGRVADRVE